MTIRFSTRFWSIIHSWTGLICAGFLLMLCLTGLPLIFHSEINAVLGFEKTAPAGDPIPSGDIVAAGALAQPDMAVQFVVWEPDLDGIVTLSMGQTPSSSPSGNETVYVAAATGRVLTSEETDSGPMDIVYRLHSTLFMGSAGTFLLGLIGLIFLVCLFSGLVLYGPFMRFQRYGEIRSDASPRSRELDRHKLIGVTIAAWMLVIGTTGLVNGWGQIVFQLWRMGQLADLTAGYDGPPPQDLASIDAAVETALLAVPDTEPYIVAFPQSLMTSAHHYGVYLRGKTPQSRFRITPVMVDASTGALTAVAEPPWYMKGLVLSQPLHFGDYGGLPLKLLWAALDLLLIYMLANGVFLWATRKKRVPES